MVAQLGKGTITKSNTMAHARTSLDGRDACQEGQYGAFLATSLGLEGLRREEPSVSEMILFRLFSNLTQH